MSEDFFILVAEKISIGIDKKTFFQDLTLEIKAGEIWGLLGPNGCGKTTLLQSLRRLLPLQAGQIFLNNKMLSQYSNKVIAQQIAFLFQDYDEHFPQTVWDYCMEARFPHRHYFARPSPNDTNIVQSFLLEMELLHLKDYNFQTLSGGEKRRLYIASVFCQTPRIYLFDEPANHLDLRHQKKIFHLFTQLAAQGAGMIMSIHDVNSVQQYCTHALLLFKNGNIKQGEKSQVLTQQNLSDLYQTPFKHIAIEDKLLWIAL